MVDREQLKNHLLLDYVLTYNKRLLQALVENPAAVLERLGLDPDAMRCPPIVHEANARAEAAVREIEALENRDPVEAMPMIAEIVSHHFARPYYLVKIPFGVRFEESQGGAGEPQEAAYTGTASVQCTWSPGCGLDVDG